MWGLIAADVRQTIFDVDVIFLVAVVVHDVVVVTVFGIVVIIIVVVSKVSQGHLSVVGKLINPHHFLRRHLVPRDMHPHHHRRHPRQ